MLRRLFVVLLLLATIGITGATRRVPALSSGACWTQNIHLNIRDTSINVTGTLQVGYDYCPRTGNATSTAITSSTADARCRGTLGIVSTIREVWYEVSETMSTIEQCKACISSATGGAPLACDGWSEVDFGDGTALLGNCDKINDVGADSELSVAGDACYVTDPVGTVITDSTEGWTLLFDQASSGTPSCTSIRSLVIHMKIQHCDVGM